MKVLKINKVITTLLALALALVLLSFANAEKCHICDFSDEPIIVTPKGSTDSSRGDVDFDFSNEPIIVHPTESNRGDVDFDFSDEPIIVHPTRR